MAIGITLIAALTTTYFAHREDAGKLGSFERVTFQRGYVKGARFAPDGRDVLYSAAWEGRSSEVFVTRIGDHHARPLDLKHAMLVGVSGGR